MSSYYGSSHIQSENDNRSAGEITLQELAVLVCWRVSKGTTAAGKQHTRWALPPPAAAPQGASNGCKPHKEARAAARVHQPARILSNFPDGSSYC